MNSGSEILQTADKKVSGVHEVGKDLQAREEARSGMGGVERRHRGRSEGGPHWNAQV